MRRFLISYDLLRGTEEEYKDLITALKDAGAVRAQKSVWYLADEDDEQTCTALRDRFREHMGPSDRLLVVRFDDWSGLRNFARIAKP